jgi:hypothetical protein
MLNMNTNPFVKAYPLVLFVVLLIIVGLQLAVVYSKWRQNRHLTQARSLVLAGLVGFFVQDIGYMLLLNGPFFSAIGPVLIAAGLIMAVSGLLTAFMAFARLAALRQNEGFRRAHEGDGMPITADR